MDKLLTDLNENDINFHVALIKQSLLKIKKLCKDHHEAYLFKDIIIINLTENILFLFFNCTI